MCIHLGFAILSLARGTTGASQYCLAADSIGVNGPAASGTSDESQIGNSFAAAALRCDRNDWDCTFLTWYDYSYVEQTH